MFLHKERGGNPKAHFLNEQVGDPKVKWVTHVCREVG